MTGYYGKVSTHGDFVGRGLPPQLVQAWDGWLQECMRASQERLGSAWLERYLISPVWRFAIAPDVLGPEGLGGVMMPSVDRVGRYFPLLVGTPGNASLLDWFHGQAGWYDGIEGMARESLDAAFTLDRFDHAPVPLLSASTPAVTGRAWRLPLGEESTSMIVSLALRGHSLWWVDGEADASLLFCCGMPPASMFASMLDGSWAGWSLPIV